MMRGLRFAWIALLVVVLVVAAMWSLPARWAMAFIPESSPVVVTDASGTMWSASATVAVGVGGLRRTLPDPVQWRLAFDGGPRLVISHPWLRGPLALSPAWNGLRLSAQSLQLPASVLTTVHALFNTLDPGGEVHLSWPQLVLGPGMPSSKDDAPLLTAQWRNASSSLTRVRPMGDYTLVLKPGSGDVIALALASSRGPLMMEGAGTLSRSRAQFDGKAWVEESASGDTHAALQGLLAAMGPSTGPDSQTLLKIR